MKFELSSGIVLFKRVDGIPQFLFLKRDEGTLDLPKGHVEKGENTYRAAIRETKEETGISAIPIPFFKNEMEYKFKFPGKELVKKRVVLYLAEISPSTEVHISNEHSSFAWLDLSRTLKLSKFKTQKKLISDCVDYIKKMDMMNAVNARYATLPERENWSLSSNLVRGEGPLDARIMIIGQAPGDYEDKTGRPFVGRSGRLLDQLIGMAGLRRENIYITSVVQFFPPLNRIPFDSEIDLCKPLLEEQIRIISPKLIILVGALSSKVVANLYEIMKIHGKPIRKNGIYYFPTLHPAAAVRIRKNMPLIESDFKRLGRLARELKFTSKNASP